MWCRILFDGIESRRDACRAIRRARRRQDTGLQIGASRSGQDRSLAAGGGRYRRAASGRPAVAVDIQRAVAAVAERTVSAAEKTTKAKISTAAATISEPIATTGSISGWPPASIQ